MRHLHCEQKCLHLIDPVSFSRAWAFRPPYVISALEVLLLFGFWLEETARYLPTIDQELSLNKTDSSHGRLL